MSPLWAIACHFNPSGDPGRLRRYRAFRQHLAVPLVAVELVYGAGGELDEDDADILIQLPGRDVLWQADRLYTLGIAAVPATCRKIAWLDADLVFTTRDWAERAAARLDMVPLVQVFSELREIRPAAAGLDPDDSRTFEVLASSTSMAHKLRHESTDVLANAVARGETAAPKARAGTGIGWAFRREVFEDGGLYHGGILGGGDRAMVCAMVGRFDLAEKNWDMSARQREHYLAWARPFHARVRGELECLDETVLHLWHGDVTGRGYGQRHRVLHDFDFDPYQDIALDQRGVLCWASAKPELHRVVREWLVGKMG